MADKKKENTLHLQLTPEEKAAFDNIAQGADSRAGIQQNAAVEGTSAEDQGTSTSQASKGTEEARGEGQDPDPEARH